MSKDDVYLSFHETLLRHSDVDLLRGPHWINDSIISFYFEYLEKVLFSKFKDVLFISPEVTQCVKMVSRDEIATFLDPLGGKKKRYIFFALNDNDQPEVAGGSHWSLLVYHRPDCAFYHLDSSSGSNQNVAKEFVQHLNNYFTPNGVCYLIKMNCPQQSNSYDCGVHLLCNTESLASFAYKHGDIANCQLPPINTSQKRMEILNIIHHLKKSS